jgi:hypothetical protein
MIPSDWLFAKSPVLFSDRITSHETSTPEIVETVLSVLGTFGLVPKEIHRFYHSGHLGDIVYGLPVLRACGGGDLEISNQHPSQDPNASPYRALTQTEFLAIGPLLVAQPYIRSVQFVHEMTPGAIDLNPWQFVPAHIAEAHLKLIHGLTTSILRRPWIVAKPKFVAPIVINRSARWHEPGAEVMWRRILEVIRDATVFVGVLQEYEDFVAKIGPIRFQPTINLLEVASIIAGATAYIGNQSCCLAIAQAMHHPRIAFERNMQKNNCDIPEIPTIKFDQAAKMERVIEELQRIAAAANPSTT